MIAFWRRWAWTIYSGFAALLSTAAACFAFQDDYRTALIMSSQASVLLALAFLHTCRLLQQRERSDGK